MADNDQDIEKFQLFLSFNLICELGEHSEDHTDYQIKPIRLS